MTTFSSFWAVWLLSSSSDEAALHSQHIQSYAAELEHLLGVGLLGLGLGWTGLARGLPFLCSYAGDCVLTLDTRRPLICDRALLPSFCM